MKVLAAIAISDLPRVNAIINTAVALLLLLGLGLIRRRRREAHRWVMLAAVALSALFLASYVTYHALHGATKFAGTGISRPIYFTILSTHTVLAVVNLPLVIVTLSRALRGRFQAHVRIAKWTWRIWLYVAVTGPIVYLMLYEIYPAPKAAALFERAQALHREQKEAEALAAYEQAAEAGHRGAGCYGAVLGDRLHETETASAALQLALKEAPSDLDCRVLAARELVYKGRAAEAVPMLERAVAGAPNNAFFQASLGFARFRLSDYKEAAAAFEESIALDPSQPANTFNAGYAHYLYGNYKAAKPLLERGVTLPLEPELKERAETYLGVIMGSLWVCPMHPDVEGKPGEKCARCGMPLEPLSHGLSEEQ